MENSNKQVFPISLGMVKTFLIKGEKNILVDTGIEGSEDKIINGLKSNGLQPNDISLIIISHNHTDHTGSLYKLKELTGAKVLIHEDEAIALKYGKSTKVNPIGPLAKLVTLFFKNSKVKGVLPDIEVKDDTLLDDYGVKGKILHTPGHTPGSLTIILENGEAIVSDMVTAKTSKNKIIATLPPFATDLSQLKESLIKLIENSPQIIYTSHGSTCGVNAIKELISKMRI